MSWEIATGWNNGYNYIVAKTKEDEVKQGKNYYQASMCQVAQVYSLSSIAGTLFTKIPYAPIRVPAVIAAEVVPLASWILFPAAAAVKQGHYEAGVKVINGLTTKRLTFLNNQLPEKLTEGTTSKISTVAEHAGDVIQAGMVVGSLALPVFGNVYFAGAMLAPVAFKVLETRNWIPRKVSLFMEQYMPTVSSATALLSGGVAAKVTSALCLASYIPQFSRFTHQKLDNLSHEVVTLQGPTLEEIDAPLTFTKDFSFEEINAILDANTLDYEINPSHCSKWANSATRFPDNHQFELYTTLSKKIDWTKKYTLLSNKLKDDDRFIDFLRTKFPGKEDLLKDFEGYLIQLAEAEKKSKEDYLADQLNTQITELVKILKGEVPVKGSQQDLEEAIDNYSQILSYLTMLKTDSARQLVELEDILMILGVEGGEYCARGHKRVSGQILNGIFQQALLKNGGPSDPQSDYELRIRQTLERERYKILEATYLKLMEILVLASKGGDPRYFSFNSETTDVHAVAMSQDVHTLDIYRKCFALGFTPLSNYERNSFSLPDLFMWGSPTHPFRDLRNYMYKVYKERLDALVKELGEINFGTYIQQVIISHEKLTKEEREILLDKYTSCNDWTWTQVDTEHRFHRLMFLMLGILRKNQDVELAEWTPLEKTEAAAYQPPIEEVQPVKKDAEEEDLSDWTAVGDPLQEEAVDVEVQETN